jgi:hypothetical protein
MLAAQAELSNSFRLAGPSAVGDDPMTKRSYHLMLLGAVVLPVLAFTFGGWAVVTVEDLPEYAVAGKPIDLSFAVRQHGVKAMSDVQPSVELSGPGKNPPSVPAARAGDRFKATLTLPRAGDWTVTVRSGWGGSDVSLIPIKVVDAGAPAPHPLPDADRGIRLFVAKGCVTCHVRGETSAWRSLNVGPVLTGRQYPPDYVAKFLADPESSPLSKTAPPNGNRMPNLGLKPQEIAALVAFLNSDGKVSSQSSSR